MMDVYEYFNSQDLAAHCQQLGHNFTAKETAYMIWKSNHHTLQQKVQAWEELINTFPDEVLPASDDIAEYSLRHFLREYIARVQGFLKEFQAAAQDCVFSYELRYADAPERYLDESTLFTSYDQCVASAMTASTSKEILSVRIKKRRLNNPSTERMGDPMLYLTPNGEAVDIIVAPYFGEVDLLVAPFGFYGWYVDLPAPFKQGDIVTGVDLWGHRSGPMVIDRLPGKQGEDYIDMCARLWELDGQGRLVCNEDTCYLSLEYYHGNLKKQKRFLYALHNYCRGELSLEDLLRSYTITLLELLAEKRVDFYGWANDIQQLAGLETDVIPIA